jgi:hypothetical protein
MQELGNPCFRPGQEESLKENRCGIIPAFSMVFILSGNYESDTDEQGIPNSGCMLLLGHNQWAEGDSGHQGRYSACHGWICE